jgi:hypothetical protein
VPLTAEQQAANLRQFEQAIYREPDLASEWLGAGLWVAYAVLALVWFRIFARRHAIRWLVAVRERVAVSIFARKKVSTLASVAEPCAPLAPEPEIAPVWRSTDRKRLPSCTSPVVVGG